MKLPDVKYPLNMKIFVFCCVSMQLICLILAIKIFLKNLKTQCIFIELYVIIFLICTRDKHAMCICIQY